MFTLLLLNGGIGSRIGANTPKQFLKVKGIPILVFPLTLADRIPEISEIVMNYPPGELETVKEIVSSYAIKTPIKYAEAGRTRHDSVDRLLQLASNDKVLVHESARPLVTVADFKRLIASAYENASLMLEIPFTVAPVDPGTEQVTGSLERDMLRNVQLPQKFNKADLVAAHAQAKKNGVTFTEDATLVATYGVPVHFVQGTTENIKITTPIDLRLANVLLNESEVEYE